MSQLCHCGFLQSSCDTRTEEEEILGMGRKLVEGEWKGRGKKVWKLLTSGSRIVLGDWGVPWVYKLMITFSLNAGQHVSPNQLGRYGVSVFIQGAFWIVADVSLGLCITQHWPGDSGSPSDSLMNASFSPDTALFLTFLFFFSWNKSLSHHSVSSDLFQNNCLKIVS